MSTQSGITAAEDLLSVLGEKRDINDDSIVVVTGKISEDATTVVLQDQLTSLADLNEILGNEPLYLFVKQPEQSGFCLLSYVPDTAPVRSKMLYASTKNTLVRQIGSQAIRKQLLVTESDEVLDALNDTSDHKAQASLLTESEKIAQAINQEQLAVKIASGGRPLVSQTDGAATTLTFNVNSGDVPIGKRLQDNNVLCFKIDDENVQIAKELAITTPDSLELITEHPSYTLYKNNDAIFFIYSCPSGSKVKDRMLYASNRSGFINYLQDKEKLTLTKIIEIGEPEELELSLLSLNDTTLDETEVESSATKKFNRPKGPIRKRRT